MTKTGEQGTGSFINIPTSLFKQTLPWLGGVFIGAGGFFGGHMTAAAPVGGGISEDALLIVNDLQAEHEGLATQDDIDDLFWIVCRLAEEHEIRDRRCLENMN